MGALLCEEKANGPQSLKFSLSGSSEKSLPISGHREETEGRGKNRRNELEEKC